MAQYDQALRRASDQQRTPEQRRWLYAIHGIYDYVLAHELKHLTEHEAKQIRHYLNLVRFRDQPVPSYPATQATQRFGPFEHLQFMLPDELVNYAFTNGLIVQLKEAIFAILDQVFSPEDQYVLGYVVYADLQTTSNLVPALHFHVILGKLRFLWSDWYEVKAFHGLHWKKKPHQYQTFFYRAEHITEIKAYLPELTRVWREVLQGMIPDVTATMCPRVEASERPDLQVDKDRQGCAWYARNKGIKLWRNTQIIFQPEQALVLVQVKGSKKCLPYKPLDFLREFIFMVTTNFDGHRFMPRGYFNHSNLFGKLMTFASEQRIQHDRYFLDQPIDIFMPSSDEKQVEQQIQVTRS